MNLPNYPGRFHCTNGVYRIRGYHAPRLPNYDRECCCGRAFCARHGNLPTDYELIRAMVRDRGGCGRSSGGQLCLLAGDHPEREEPCKFTKSLDVAIRERLGMFL